MRIEIVGANPGMPVSARVNVSAVNGTRKRTVVMTYVIYFDSPPLSLSLLSLSLRILEYNLQSLMSPKIEITYDVYQF
jgi:hypothetical protein